jgi:hypothetical protein
VISSVFLKHDIALKVLKGADSLKSSVHDDVVKLDGGCESRGELLKLGTDRANARFKIRGKPKPEIRNKLN